MLYVISKEPFGEYNVHDIQANSCWCECVLDGYVAIPDTLLEGILATKGYCDLVLSSDGTQLLSFTAREIPEAPTHCDGYNSVLSVDGHFADDTGNVALDHKQNKIESGETLPSPGEYGRIFVKIVTPTSNQVVTLSNPTFFEKGASASTKVVGTNYDNCVVRYEFTTADAATGIAFEKGSLSLGGGTAPDLKFHITADDSSYANADKTYEGTALTRRYNATDDKYTFSGELAAELLPSTTYYLWVFPATSTYGFVYWNNADGDTATVTGRKKHGEFYLDTGTEWIPCS